MKLTAIALAAYVYVLCGIGTLRAVQIMVAEPMPLHSQLYTVATWPASVTAAALYKLMTL